VGKYMGRARRGKERSDDVTLETIREIALALPETAEGPSYGTPGFRVRGKLFARLHDTGHTLVARIDVKDRAMRLKADPEVYYLTDHYVNYPWILARFGRMSREDLRELLEESWRLAAPKRLLEQRPRTEPAGD
jgi:hypothetical protein